MTQQEREHIIEWLSVWMNENRDYFKDWSDDQLLEKYEDALLIDFIQQAGLTL